MRTAFGKVLVGYEVPAGRDVNAKVLQDVYLRLPGVLAHTPPRISKGVWRMAVYYRNRTRDDPAALCKQFQVQLEERLDRVVNVRWFNVGPSSKPGEITLT